MKLPPLPDAGHPMLQWAPDAQHDLRSYGLACARAALEQAIKLCKAEEDRLWRAYKGHGTPSEKGNPHTEGASDQCAVLAAAIRALAKEIT